MQTGLGRNVAANVATTAVLMGTGVLSIPIILSRVGLAGFGIWTLAQTVIIYAGILEGGFGSGVQRFIAVSSGAREQQVVPKLLWTSLAAYALLGGAALVASQLAAPGFVSLFDVPQRLSADAESMFRIVGGVVMVALLAAAMGNALQGLERFVAVGVTTAIGSVAFLVAVIVLLASGQGLVGVAYAALVQQAVTLVARAGALWDVLSSGRPGLIGRAQGRRLLAFSAKMQVSALSTLLNSQTDKIVVGLLAPAAMVGQLGIGTQVAEAGRAVFGAAISPMVSRMSATHGDRDSTTLSALYARLNRLWIVAVTGFIVIGTASLYPLIAGWLGPGHGKAALLGGFLVVAYGINLLPGTIAAYLRAVGRPGPEARYAVLFIVLNISLTIPLGIALGPTGVVAATTCTYAIGVTAFFLRTRHLRPAEPPRALRSTARMLSGGVTAGAASLGWGLLSVELLPAGVALVPVALGTGAAMVAYLSWINKVRPTLANVRRLLGFPTNATQ